MTPYQQGYQAYYNNSDNCPYDYDTDYDHWSDWCAGHMEAYCEDEGK